MLPLKLGSVPETNNQEVWKENVVDDSYSWHDYRAHRVSGSFGRLPPETFSGRVTQLGLRNIANQDKTKYTLALRLQVNNSGRKRNVNGSHVSNTGAVFHVFLKCLSRA